MLVEDLAGLMSDRFTLDAPKEGSLPLGTLTFMFGDLAGSTALVEQLGDRYAEVLSGYHGIVDDATRRHGGTVVDLEGERLFSVFLDAFEAVTATVEIHMALDEGVWPDSAPVHARLGLHTGTARIGSGGYVGLDVHRASRVASSAHGGQIMVSAPVKELVESQTEDMGWEIRELGSYALKGLSASREAVSSGCPGDSVRFPGTPSSQHHESSPSRASERPGRQGQGAGGARRNARPPLCPSLHHRRARWDRQDPSRPVGGGTGSAVFPDGVYFVNLAAVTEASDRRCSPSVTLPGSQSKGRRSTPCPASSRTSKSCWSSTTSSRWRRVAHISPSCLLAALASRSWPPAGSPSGS